MVDVNGDGTTAPGDVTQPLNAFATLVFGTDASTDGGTGNVAATDTALGTSFATLSADLDNASFDTISISDGQASAFDEIRFGTSLASVTPGLFAVPEPSSMMILIGLGGLGMIRRRK